MMSSGMRPPVSPLSTTTTRRSSVNTLATRIPPNYEPGSRFRVLAPDGSEVDVTVPAGAEAGDMIQVPLQGGVLHVHRRRRLRGCLLRHVLRVLRDRADGAPRVPRGRDWHRALRLLLGDGGDTG